MSKARLFARKNRRRSPADTGLRPEHSIAPNLPQREVEADVPNRKWLADFTYFWTDEDWLHLAIRWAPRESNPAPTDYESAALTIMS